MVKFKRLKKWEEADLAYNVGWHYREELKTKQILKMIGCSKY